ncbi:MAG TPA: hypothetical protein PLK94_13445 [Alphaproteobacteria bacterium]|nr:hypothetical protein [Alphaproteobacteria bacterium]
MYMTFNCVGKFDVSEIEGLGSMFLACCRHDEMSAGLSGKRIVRLFDDHHSALVVLEPHVVQRGHEKIHYSNERIAVHFSNARDANASIVTVTLQNPFRNQNTRLGLQDDFVFNGKAYWVESRHDMVFCVEEGREWISLDSPAATVRDDRETAFGLLEAVQEHLRPKF